MLDKFADKLGIKLESVTPIDDKIYSEKRYLVIIEVFRKTARAYSNMTPNKDINKAKAEAMENIKIKKDDVVSFRAVEITYATVPIETMLTKTKYELQPVHSRWMTHDEIESLLTK